MARVVRPQGDGELNFRFFSGELDHYQILDLYVSRNSGGYYEATIGPGPGFPVTVKSTRPAFSWDRIGPGHSLPLLLLEEGDTRSMARFIFPKTKGLMSSAKV